MCESGNCPECSENKICPDYNNVKEIDEEEKELITDRILEITHQIKVRDFIDMLMIEIDKIPEEFREYIYISSDYFIDYGIVTPYFCVELERNETDDEYRLRIQEEKDNLTYNEKLEYETYLKLKEKYEKI